MAEWKQLCSAADAPPRDEVKEIELEGRMLCLANVGGTLHALDNWCPHRQGPLGQGWIEGETVVCPWHAWAFDCRTGVALEPERAEVKVFPVRTEGDAVLTDLS